MSRKNPRFKRERRRNSRSDVQIWAVEKDDNSTSFHLLTNLSIEGFFIEKKLPLPVGSIVNLELELDGEKLPLRGKIIDNYEIPNTKNFFQYKPIDIHFPLYEINNHENVINFRYIDKYLSYSYSEFYEKKLLGDTDKDGKEIGHAHKNARYTVRINELSNADPNLHNPDGVPISGVIYGGRDSDTSVPVFQSLSWEHGVYIGATIESETTAATIGQVGVRKFSPMANLDFLVVQLGKYIKNHINFGNNLKKPPLVFATNYFIKENDEFLNDLLLTIFVIKSIFFINISKINNAKF